MGQEICFLKKPIEILRQKIVSEVAKSFGTPCASQTPLASDEQMLAEVHKLLGGHSNLQKPLYEGCSEPLLES